MPVLFNAQTGLAENVPDNVAQQALQSGSHEIPLNDPEGNPVSAPHDSVSDLLQQGYSNPAPEHLNKLLEHAHFNSTTEQAKTFAEGAGSALSLGLSTGLERAAGVKAEDILKRKEANPGVRMLGEMTGLGLGMLTGTGEAKLMEKAGVATAEKLATATAMNRIGTQAAKMAAENMVFQAGSEIDKMFMSDPSQSVQTAIADVGLSAAIGAGFGGFFGGVNELWKMGPGKNVESMLSAMKNRSSGLPSELKTAANIELAPEIESALGNSPKAREAAEALLDSGSKSGTEFQESMGKFKQSVNEALPEVFERTADDITNIANESKYEAGKAFQEKLGSALDERIKPIAEQYDAFEQKFKNVELSAEDKSEMVNQVARVIEEQGLIKGQQEGALNMANKMIEQMPLQSTAQDLRKYAQGLMHKSPYGSENYYVARQLKNILVDAQENVIGRAAGEAGPETFAAFKQTQTQYGEFKALLEDLNDRLHLGRKAEGGAATFIGELKAMDPESIVNRLRLKDDVGLQNLLAEKFPEVAEMAKRQELNQLLKRSMHANGEHLDAKKLFKQLDALSPELRKNLISEPAMQRLEAIKDLIRKAPSGQNTSRTATVLDKLWSKMPASVGGMAAMLIGHNPISGFVLGEMTHWLGREAPDAAKLAMLKYLGSAEAVSGPGFKAAVDMAEAVIKGEAKLNKAVKGVFGASMPPMTKPDIKDREKLQKRIDQLVANREEAFGIGAHVGHYLPDHGAELGLTSARAISYLEAIKPVSIAKNPLDQPMKPNPVQVANYNRALDLAQNPMLVLEDIKSGMLNSKDIVHLQNMYPGLLQQMQMKLNQQMIEAISEGKEMPYKTKMSLSLFMNQPLENSLTPQAISASQPQVFIQPPHMAKASPARADKLQNLSQSYLTQNQSRIMNRQGRR